MGKVYVMILMLAVVLVHASARNIPNDDDPNNLRYDKTLATNANAMAPVQNVVSTTADAPSANGVEDQKNFITYGGVGGWAGIGGFAGVVPALGGVGGLGGVPGGGSGLGGLGGLGGVGGGVGGGAGIGGVGGVGGVGGLPGVGGVGGKGGGILP